MDKVLLETSQRVAITQQLPDQSWTQWKKRGSNWTATRATKKAFCKWNFWKPNSILLYFLPSIGVVGSTYWNIHSKTTFVSDYSFVVSTFNTTGFFFSSFQRLFLRYTSLDSILSLISLTRLHRSPCVFIRGDGNQNSRKLMSSREVKDWCNRVN